MIPKQDLQSNNLRDSLWESILRMEAELKDYRAFVEFMRRESARASHVAELALASRAAKQVEEVEVEKFRA